MVTDATGLQNCINESIQARGLRLPQGILKELISSELPPSFQEQPVSSQRQRRFSKLPQCAHCLTSVTSQWRNLNHSIRLCNACLNKNANGKITLRPVQALVQGTLPKNRFTSSQIDSHHPVLVTDGLHGSMTSGDLLVLLRKKTGEGMIGEMARELLELPEDERDMLSNFFRVMYKVLNGATGGCSEIETMSQMT